MKSMYRVILFLMLLVPLCKTGAATLIVTSTADSGPGTLRDALAGAGDGDTINATRIHGIILLNSGELFVNKSVVITGPGPGKLAVDGNYLSRVFHIGSNVVAEITGLTITHGVGSDNYGGGIYNDHAKLTVNKCIVIGNFGEGAGIANDGYSGKAILMVVNSLVISNSAPIESENGGGIFNNGYDGIATVALENSTVSDNNTGFLGGGIFNNGFNGRATLTVVNSTVKNNNAGYSGGGIYNAGWSGTASLNLERSTVTGNQAGNSGGGAYNAGYGGAASLTITDCAITGNRCLYTGLGGGGLCNGISGGSALMKLVNSTISGNSADIAGGIFNGHDYVVPIFGPGNASLQILNCTLNNNSAQAIYLVNGAGTGTVEIGSTIINASAPGSTISFGGSSAFTSLGYNLSSDDGAGGLTNATDLINTDPLLGPLQDNGGPTFTCALLLGSPAIDQGKNFSGAFFDQRGFGYVRTFDSPSIPNAPGGDGTDIGAFEVQPPGFCAIQAVQRLLAFVESQVKRPQPLDATLEVALASIDRNNPTVAINQLAAFQDQVRAQVMPSNLALAKVLLTTAQNAINVLNATRH